MAQVLSGFSFEIIPDPEGGDAKMTVLMLPHLKGISGQITLGEIAELTRYFDGVMDKMLSMKKQNTKGEKL